MFTGIVEELGSVVRREGDRLGISCKEVLTDVELGSSIAVNGCCLTVVAWDVTEGWFEADVTAETWNRTQLDDLQIGDGANLERPVKLQDRLGGHLVQGHVDAVGAIVNPAPDLEIEVEASLLAYVVEKGSITVDGISLTVVTPKSGQQSSTFTVAVIPHTSDITTLGIKKRGDRVNIEVDVMAKYAEKLLAGYMPDGGGDV